MNCLEAAWRLFAATGQVNFYLLYKELEREDYGEGATAEITAEGCFDEA